jgi:tetratricopeptide (TPR) repeat protein
LEEAQHFLEQAIVLDPSFALARARLSRIHSQIFQTYQPLDVHRQSSKAEAEEALRLQPDLSEAHLAMGAYFGRVERDYPKALKEYEFATKATPNDSTVLSSTGFIRMRQGYFRKAIVDLERAATLDPRNLGIFDALGVNVGTVAGQIQ